MTRVNPHEVVLPLFTRDPVTGQGADFLGTGFFIERGGQFVTAYHNLPNLNTPLCVASLTEMMFYSAEVRTYDADADLAVLEVTGYRPPAYFVAYPSDSLPLGKHVTCVEYGPTRKLGEKFEISDAVRMGNITRHLTHLQMYGKAGENAIEVSFPALLGASGAPVFLADTAHVIGVIRANASYHLIPAQIEQNIYDDGRELENVRYMLPQAIAVHIKHLRPLLVMGSSSGASPTLDAPTGPPDFPPSESDS